jgi:hypothetical protein
VPKIGLSKRASRKSIREYEQNHNFVGALFDNRRPVDEGPFRCELCDARPLESGVGTENLIRGEGPVEV